MIPFSKPSNEDNRRGNWSSFFLFRLICWLLKPGTRPGGKR